MSFLHPAFLWALTALAIPVLIHLFQLRRFKRIDFPNVRFLAEVSQQTRARKKVQHWLVLLARCLAIAALVLAFAQPYIPGLGGAVKAGPRAVSLFVDDSYSMDGQNANGRLLDQARKSAQDAVMAYGATDRFQLLTGRFEGKQQLLTGRDEALQAAAQVDVAPYTRALSQVIARQRAALSGSDALTKRAFLFTDLQRSITDVEAWTNDTAIPTVIVPLPVDRRDNLSLDSAWFSTPVRRSGQSEVLNVRITNHGEQELVNVPLRLSVNGEQRALATFSVAGNASVDTTLQFLSEGTGERWGTVSISDQPVTFDDVLPIAYRIIDRSRILLISGGDTESDKAVRAVFGTDSADAFIEQGYREVNIAALEEQDLVVLNAVPEIASGLVQALEAFVRSGGSLVVFPPSNEAPTGHVGLFTAFGAAPPVRLDTNEVKVERIDLEQPFYRDVFQTMPRNVDLPVARERWRLEPAAGSDALLRMQDGNIFLGRTEVDRGSVYLCASPLKESATNLTRHALFATSLLRMTELARPMGRLYHTLGADAVIPLEGIDLNGGTAPHLRGPEGTDIVPEVRRTPGNTSLALHDEDLPPGPYALTVENDTLAIIALAVSRRESDLSSLDVAALQQLLVERGLNTFSILENGADDMPLRLAELDQGRKLWKWFIALAILFLALETILLRTTR